MHIWTQSTIPPWVVNVYSLAKLDIASKGTSYYRILIYAAYSSPGITNKPFCYSCHTSDNCKIKIVLWRFHQNDKLVMQLSNFDGFSSQEQNIIQKMWLMAYDNLIISQKFRICEILHRHSHETVIFDSFNIHPHCLRKLLKQSFVLLYLSFCYITLC